MFNELLSIFRPGNPLSMMADEFAAMLRLTCEMTDTAGRMLFQETTAAEDRTGIYKKDVKVNKLERSIRKRVVAHLAIHGNSTDLPYCLLLMSLVKDVERLGDYAKNITEILDLYSGDLGDDAIAEELREIRAGVEETFRESASVFLVYNHQIASLDKTRLTAHHFTKIFEYSQAFPGHFGCHRVGVMHPTNGLRTPCRARAQHVFLQ